MNFESTCNELILWYWARVLIPEELHKMAAFPQRKSQLVSIFKNEIPVQHLTDSATQVKHDLKIQERNQIGTYLTVQHVFMLCS